MARQSPSCVMFRRPHLTRRHALIFTSAAIFLILLFASYIHNSELKTFYQTRILSDIELECTPMILPIISTASASTLNQTIPNIVHYVWLLNGRASLSFDFKTFISIYSAELYFRPVAIYIHTDATPAQWTAAQTHGSESTLWTLRIPSLVYHQITPPTYTLSCRKILKIEHASDFIRTAELHRHGGIYMDTDVIPIRDISPLRSSGFANIMGIEARGRVNNGVMMCVPGSALLSIFMSEQHRVFDNRWTSHSVELLSRIAYRLQAVPWEVLILGTKAFSPSGWSMWEIEALFKPHGDRAAGRMPTTSGPQEQDLPSEMLDRVPGTSFQSTVDYWTSRDVEVRDRWEVDYSGSYVIHAFDGKPEAYWAQRVSLEYVLARRSNYARAVYPAVKHALMEGVIDQRPVVESEVVEKVEKVKA